MCIENLTGATFTGIIFPNVHASLEIAAIYFMTPPHSDSSDGSGKLGKEEMHQALAMLGIVLSAEEFEKMWSEMDSDGGGQVGFREFKVRQGR